MRPGDKIDTRPKPYLHSRVIEVWGLTYTIASAGDAVTNDTVECLRRAMVHRWRLEPAEYERECAVQNVTPISAHLRCPIPTTETGEPL